MKLVFYVYKNEKYLDFQTILAMYNKSRSDLYRYLLKSERQSKIGTVYFHQRKLYKWDDILRDTNLMENLDFDIIVKEFG